MNRAHLEHEISGCPPPPVIGPRPGAEWVTLSQAYWMLGQRSLNGLGPFKPLKHVLCSAPSGVTGRRPWLVKRRDVEWMVLLRREAGLSASAAARVVAAANDGRI
jgi:hypothetical protein